MKKLVTYSLFISSLTFALAEPAFANECPTILEQPTEAVAAALAAAQAEMSEAESYSFYYYKSYDGTKAFVNAFKKISHQPDRAETMQYLRALVLNNKGYRGTIIQGWQAVAKISKMVNLPVDDIGELQLMMANHLDQFKYYDERRLQSDDLKTATDVLLAAWSPFRLFAPVVYGEKTLQARLIAMQRLTEHGTDFSKTQNDLNSLLFALKAFTSRRDLDRESIHRACFKMIEMMDAHWYGFSDGKLFTAQQAYAVHMIAAIVNTQNDLWSDDLSNASGLERMFKAREKIAQIRTTLGLFIDKHLNVYSRYGYKDVDYKGRALRAVAKLAF